MPTLDSRFKTRVRTAHHRVEHLADRPADDEVGAVVVDEVHPQGGLPRQADLRPQVELLDGGVLHGVVDDVDAARAGPGQDEAREGIGEGRGERRHRARARIEEEHVAGADLDGQGAAVEAALERDDLEGDPVVVDPVAAVKL